MSFISTIGTGGFAAYTRSMRSFSGDVPIDFQIYGASEAMMATCTHIEEPEFALLVDSCFFEFLPADAPADCTDTLNIDQLEVGKEYEIIITDLSGDKITESMMDETIRRTGEELGVNLIDYCVYPNREVSPPRYEFLIEPDGPLDPSKCDEYRQILEKHLGEVNPVYKECRDTTEIDQAVLYVQQQQTHALWRDMKVHKGTSLNQVKPVRVLDTPMKQKFFYGLLEQ